MGDCRRRGGRCAECCGERGARPGGGCSGPPCPGAPGCARPRDGWAVVEGPAGHCRCGPGCRVAARWGRGCGVHCGDRRRRRRPRGSHERRRRVGPGRCRGPGSRLVWASRWWPGRDARRRQGSVPRWWHGTAAERRPVAERDVADRPDSSNPVEQHRTVEHLTGQSRVGESPRGQISARRFAYSRPGSARAARHPRSTKGPTDSVGGALVVRRGPSVRRSRGAP